MLIRKDNNSLVFSVFRKATHNNRYLNRRSCHPPQVFKGLATCFKYRAESICSKSELPKEINKLKNALISNDYTEDDLKILYQASSKKRCKPKHKRVSLPFIPGLANRIRRIFSEVDVQVCFAPPVSLGSILSKKKPKNSEVKGLVYRIPCTQCDWSYVGETGRTLNDRIKEHKRAVKNMSTASEIANHCLNEDHRMDWEGSKIIGREKWHTKRLFKEAWCSNKYQSGNRTFIDLNKAWNSCIS